VDDALDGIGHLAWIQCEGQVGCALKVIQWVRWAVKGKENSEKLWLPA
jgi:hypothetical protein